MAEASKAVLSVPVTVYESRNGINLKLEEDEAKLLSAILAHVGGDPYCSLRKVTDGIKWAIEEANGRWRFSDESAAIGGTGIYISSHATLTDLEEVE